jgi:hypothetical protein
MVLVLAQGMALVLVLGCESIFVPKAWSSELKDAHMLSAEEKNMPHNADLPPKVLSLMASQGDKKWTPNPAVLELVLSLALVLALFQH